MCNSRAKPFFDFLTHDQEHTLVESVAGSCSTFSTHYWGEAFRLTDEQVRLIDSNFVDMASERYEVDLCVRCNWWTHQGEVMSFYEGEQLCPDCQEEVSEEEDYEEE